MSKNVLKIESMNALHSLMESLVQSGYDIRITPVHEIPECEKDRAKRIPSYKPYPRLKHYTVEIGDKHAAVPGDDGEEF